MEIPVIESGITRFQSPNLVLHLRTLWTWAALIVTVAATFSSLIKRSKRIFLRLGKGKTVNSNPPPSTYSYDYDDDDASCSSCSEDEEEEVEEEEEEDDELSSAGSKKDFGDFEEIRGQTGKSESYFAWPELSRDGSVVKFWDGLGLGLGFNRSKSFISLLDLNRDEILRSFLWESDEIQAVHVASPETFLSGGVRGLKVWDARAGGAAPAASAGTTWRGEWLMGIGGENNEVYVGDDVGKLIVVDLRNVRSPLAETWWWGDGADTAGDGAGLVSWCRNAAGCLTRL